VSDLLDERYADILAAISGAADHIGPGHLTSHWPLAGRRFDHGVLVVGQAVYGWISDWTTADADTPAGRAAIVRDSRSIFADRDDPMSWIEGHRVHNTPFWRTAHDVADALTPGDGPWYSRVAWANLYPVAPNDYKGNPEGILREVQTAPAARFLDAVVDELEPCLILVLAGPFIWPFVGPLGLDGLEQAKPPFTLVGRRRDRRWICGMHPGGAQRRGWPARRYAELVVALAQTMNGSMSDAG
jgi:hypothetical protein